MSLPVREEKFETGQWMVKMLHRGTQKFIVRWLLDIKDYITLPLDFFTSQALEELHLSNKFDISFPASMHYPYLRVCKLRYVMLDVESVKNLTMRCSLLEELEVDACHAAGKMILTSSSLKVFCYNSFNIKKAKYLCIGKTPESLELHTPNLELLSIVDHLRGLKDLVIRAPAVKYITLSCESRGLCLRMDDMPAIVEARMLHIDGEVGLVFLRAVHQAKFLEKRTLGLGCLGGVDVSHVPVFFNLTSLDMELHEDLLHMIRILPLPNLKCLRILAEDPFLGITWEAPALKPAFMDSLEELCVHGFDYMNCDALDFDRDFVDPLFELIQILAYIFKESKSLKSMNLYGCAFYSESDYYSGEQLKRRRIDVTRTLKNRPRANQNCKIVLH